MKLEEAERQAEEARQYREEETNQDRKQALINSVISAIVEYSSSF